MKTQLLSLIVLLFLGTQTYAQFGIGLVAGNDIYHRYQNPDGGSAGNAILNVHIGPKIWIGGDNFSVSLESSINWGTTSLSLVDFKGMGDVAYPLLAKLNFNGSSGFSSEMTSGWSIGGGYQFARTELYGVDNSAANEDVIRELYPVAVGELSYGYGIGGFYAELYGRFGWDPSTKASTLNVGVNYNINLIGFRKLRKKIDRFDN